MLHPSLRSLLGLVLAAWLGGVATPADALQDGGGELALGSAGELYSVVAGPYGELFPQSGGADPATPVLALDVTHPGQATERLLVPGTADAYGDVEGGSSLVYEDTSETLFLVWESRRNVIHPMLNLISFDGTEWSEPLVIMSNFFALKGSPKLAITHDSYTAEQEGEPQSLHRAVLHLSWWEEGIEETEVLYAPIVLDNGSYPAAEPPIFRLNDFQLEEPGPPVALAEDFARRPTLHAGLEHRSVVLGFADASSGRYLTLEVTVLPAELGLLADGIHQQVVDSGFDFDLDELESFAGTVRGNIIDIGRNLNQRNLTFLADDIRGNIIDIGREWNGGLVPFSDAIRGNIIDIGSNLFGGEVARLYNSHGFIVVEVVTPDAAPPQARSHFLSLRLVTDRALPDLEHPASAIFVSESGEHVLIAWEAEGEVRYVESEADGWSAERALALGEGLDSEGAYGILESRTRTR